MWTLRRGIDVWRRAVSRGVFPHQFAWALELPWRRLVLSPELLASRLAVRPGATLLELGAGSGYYSARVAGLPNVRHLALCDLQPEMLERCRRAVRSAAAGSAQADVMLAVGDGVALPFADGIFDLVYMVTVLGEVYDRQACLREIRRVLRRDGSISVSEHLPDPDFVTLRALREAAEQEGFRLERWHGSSWAYTAEFRRR